MEMTKLPPSLLTAAGSRGS